MGKLEDKRIELARKILDTTDADTLASVERALAAPVPYQFAEEEIRAFEDYLARYGRGEEKASSWPEVKKRLLRSSGK